MPHHRILPGGGVHAFADETSPAFRLWQRRAKNIQRLPAFVFAASASGLRAIRFVNGDGPNIRVRRRANMFHRNSAIDHAVAISTVISLDDCRVVINVHDVPFGKAIVPGMTIIKIPGGNKGIMPRRQPKAETHSDGMTIISKSNSRAIAGSRG